MTYWQTIDSAPRDGSVVICWREGWEHPITLIWKMNRRMEMAREECARRRISPMGVALLNETYFGDPDEDDDYWLAKPGCGPTHWLPWQPLPEKSIQEIIDDISSRQPILDRPSE